MLCFTQILILNFPVYSIEFIIAAGIGCERTVKRLEGILTDKYSIAAIISFLLKHWAWV